MKEERRRRQISDRKKENDINFNLLRNFSGLLKTYQQQVQIRKNEYMPGIRENESANFSAH